MNHTLPVVHFLKQLRLFHNLILNTLSHPPMLCRIKSFTIHGYEYTVFNLFMHLTNSMTNPFVGSTNANFIVS